MALCPQRLDSVLLALWGTTPSIPVHSERGLGRHVIHTGHDAHHSNRLWLRQEGSRYPTACAGLGWRKRYTPLPASLYLKRHRDTIHRTPLSVLHTHDQLGSLWELWTAS